MRLALIAAAFVLLAAPLASAGPQAGAPTPPLMAGSVPPDQASQAIIDQGGAGDVFTVAVVPGLYGVRHTQSGMVCRFRPDATSRVVVFPFEASNAPRGDDVACDSTYGNESVTFYATRYRPARTVAQALDYAVSQMRARFPGLEPVTPGASGLPDVTGPPASQTASFLMSAPGGLAFTRVSVAIVDGWEIKMRYTARITDRSEAAYVNTLAEGDWRYVLSSFTAAHAT